MQDDGHQRALDRVKYWSMDYSHSPWRASSFSSSVIDKKPAPASRPSPWVTSPRKPAHRFHCPTLPVEFFFTTHHSCNVFFLRKTLRPLTRLNRFRLAECVAVMTHFGYIFPPQEKPNFLPAFASHPSHTRSICIKLCDSIICEPLQCNGKNTRKTVDPLLECPGFVVFIFQLPGTEKLRPQVSASACIKEVTRGVQGIQRGKPEGRAFVTQKLLQIFIFLS